MKYLRDIAVGSRSQLGSHTFTASEIKDFARRYDPQPFHLDEEAAARTHFKHLCASGWHTAAAWMRLFVDFRQRETEAQIARGEPVAEPGVGAGIRDLRWLRPVYVGDTITYDCEVVEVRQSASRPDRGIVALRGTGVNQHGETVISFISSAFSPWAPPTSA